MAKKKIKDPAAYEAEIEQLQLRLEEAEETLRAIREGEVDAVVVSGDKGEQIFSLVGVDSIYRLIVETMNEAAFTTTIDGKILFCNAQFSEFVKRPSEQVIGHQLHEFVTENNRAVADCLLAAAQKQPVKQRLVFQSVDGTAVPAHISANVLNQPDGLSICVVASNLTDLENSTELIQQLRQQGEQLRESRNQFRVLTHNLVSGVALFDEQGRLAIVNPAFFKLFDLPADSDLLNIKDRGWAKWQVFDEKGELLDFDEHPARQAALTGKAVRDRLVAVKSPSTGNLKWILITAEPVLKPDGRMEALICTYHDITARKQAEDALRRTADELARSNKDLEAFAYVASHDLQAPLRSVTAFVNLLRDRYKGQLDAKADEYIDFAVNGAAQMTELITDLLAYAKVGNKDVKFQSINLQEPVYRAVQHLRPAIEESGAKITVEELPQVQAHMGEMAQVFQNLIGNAIKFRSERPLEVEISAKREDGQWLIGVKDNGIGMDTKYSHKAFELFQRLHDRSKYSGTGIGLAICKKIVERHGGRIWVESVPGNGATFFFTLPA